MLSDSEKREAWDRVASHWDPGEVANVNDPLAIVKGDTITIHLNGLGDQTLQPMTLLADMHPLSNVWCAYATRMEAEDSPIETTVHEIPWASIRYVTKTVTE